MKTIRSQAVVLLLLTAVAARGQFGSQPVGIATAARSVTVTAAQTGAVSSVEVLTMGAAGLDFAQVAGASECSTASFSRVGQTYTESIIFTPAVPGLRMGAVELLDANGRVLGTSYLSGIGLGGLGVLVPGNEVMVTGNSTQIGPVAEGNPAMDVELSLPAGIAMDGAGNLYIADSGHHRIRMICASGTSATIEGTSCAEAGSVSTIAGNGTPNDSGDQGPASAATLNDPSGLAIDGAGNLYIADSGNNAIRMIASASGIISTVAGVGGAGFSGDGGPATAAMLKGPQGAAIDSGGNLYIADTGNGRIRKIDATTETITTVAGNGFTNANGDGGYSGNGGPATSAALNFPRAVSFDSSGNLYIADTANNRVRVVAAVASVIGATSTIATFAGNGTQSCSGDGGAASQAGLSGPSSLAIDAAGNVFIADTGNNAIRKVNAATRLISTVIGAGVGNSYQDGQVRAATFNGPTGLLLDGSGNLFVADTLNMQVREIVGNDTALHIATPVRQFEESSPTSQTIENDGNEPLNVASIIAGKHAALDESTNSCAPGNSLLPSGSVCAIGAVFAPTAAGNPQTGAINIGIRGETPNTPLLIELVGNATAANSTTIAVASSPNPAGFGQDVTLTATVTTGAGSGNLTGTATFYDGTTTLATGVALGSLGTTAAAAFSTALLAVGKHSITATYSGDAGHLSSSSTDPNGFRQPRPPLIQDVLEGTSTNVASSANPSSPNQSVTFTGMVASLAAGGLTPDGSITFMDGTTILANVALNGNATAAYTTAALSRGAHPITSTYGGDAAKDIVGSTSQILNQEVQTATTNTLTSSQNPSVFGSPVTFTSTIAASGVAATGAVNFLDGDVKIGTATLAGVPAAATFTTSALNVATHSMTAAYAGDAVNGASNSAPLSQSVAAAGAAGGFTVALEPALTLKTTQNATMTVTLTSSGGFTDTIGLGCASLPVGVSCHFATVNVALAANNSATDQLTIDTNNPLTGGASAMNSRSDGRGASLAGALVSFSLLFGGILWRFRKRHTGVWNVLLAVLLSATTLLIAGCSGVIVRDAVPGMYVIRVTGTGINTNSVQYQNVTLTITN